MKNSTISTQILWGLTIAFIFLCGCGHRIHYHLNNRDIVSAPSTKPLTVQVAKLTDERPMIERQKNAREEAGFKDSGDYTYDKEFEGEVAESLTKMMIKHLEYSKIFEEITLTNYLSEEIEPDVLPTLKRQGVDLVMTGKIKNFYGYYNQRPGPQTTYALLLGVGIGFTVGVATITEETSQIGGPFSSIQITEKKTNSIATGIGAAGGVYLGYYLESLAKRKIEWQNKLSIKLYDTSTQDMVWEKTYDISADIKDSMPGINTSGRKSQVVVKALREAVNEMVKDFSSLSLTTSK